mmetsp:Transcript_25356/g.33906  ORF Transcript_25356/g.33906 Transcript_25356/m.33906 type:complete len:148 (-) Transcript_25356:41-484(-)
MSWDTVPDHLAEVALPFASRTGLGVAQTVSMESPWAIVTADEFARLLADAADVDALLRVSALLLGCDAFTICHDGVRSVLKELLLEHVKALHVDFLEDKHGVVPGVHIHHIFISDRNRDWPAWSAHQLRHVQVSAQILVHDRLFEET